jgi:hypothetical protein
MALPLEKTSTQQFGPQFGHIVPSDQSAPSASVLPFSPEPAVPVSKGRLTAAELDDIAAEFEDFFEESGGVFAY